MQADSMSRFFAITVTDNGAAWTPPDGAAWTVRFGAPGMPAGWYDTITEPGGGTHPAVVVDENTATVEIAEQAVSAPGNNVLCVLVTDAQGYQIASWPFLLNVQAVPGLEAPEATVYYNALTAQVAQTLTNAQSAAASASAAAQSASKAAASAASIDGDKLVNITGGTTGQVPQITDDGYVWTGIQQVPTGGTEGQVLQRGADGYEWGSIQQVPTGGTEGQVLQRGEAGYGWETITPSGIGAATSAQGVLADSAVQPYKAGDTVSYGSAMLAARATTSNIQVTFPLAKPCTAGSASISGTVSIRAADATLLANNYSFSASASPGSNAITATIPISYDTPPTNYTLVSALLTGISITFS